MWQLTNLGAQNTLENLPPGSLDEFRGHYRKLAEHARLRATWKKTFYRGTPAKDQENDERTRGYRPLKEPDPVRGVSSRAALVIVRSLLMKRFAIPAISLAALMASGIAFAQTTPPKPVEQQKQVMPSQTGKPSVQQKNTAAQPAPSTGTNVVVTVDAKNAVLASKFIGTTVYSSANENVGDINDIVFDDKGSIQAVIIGVGGFLGMGEKDVAMPLNKITVTRDETNAIKLTVQASRAELDKAPAFDKTLFMVKTPAPETTTGGTGTGGTGTGGTGGTGGSGG